MHAFPGMIRDRARRHPVACFLLVTCAVSWGAWLPYAAAGRHVTIGLSAPYLLGLIGPLVGAFVTTALVGGRPGLRELLARMVRVRTGGPWWIVALGAPILVAGASYVLATAYSVMLLAPVNLPTWGELGAFNGFPITNALALWAMLVVVNGFGEETGWRGFLLPELQRRWSPLAAGALVGVCWALWHAPAFLVSETYRLMPAAMLPVFFVGIVAGSVFLTWLYNRGRQSIALVAVCHGTFSLLTGSLAGRGLLAAAETAAVIVFAAALLVQELRATHRERTGRLARHGMAPG